MNFKSLLSFIVLLAVAVPLQACSTNPATGKQQFTALMSPQQENQVGAEEHENVVKQFGLYDDPKLTQYVRNIGAKVTKNTERPDVQYKFYVIDSPIVNAFALPGGYIYVSRGLLALANNEAQLAAVLSHEAGHITGRHSAERYSRGVVTSLGSGILGAVIGSQAAAEALNTGASLYLSSYSRTQENEADSLGLRYMSDAGYKPEEMVNFLSALQAQSGLEARLAGKSGDNFNYFSTHPATSDRVQKTLAQSKGYQSRNVVNREEHLSAINGMTYGDSAKQGFIRGQGFYHPEIGFTFEVPDSFKLANQSSAVIATDKSGAVILYDMASRKPGQNAASYLTQDWARGKNLRSENITINGMPAAAASFEGMVNGQPMTLQVIAIEWSSNRFARFTIGIPQGASQSLITALKSSSYSFRRMNNAEKQKYKPYTVRVVTAQGGDTASSMARTMPFDDLKEERFRVMNGLLPNEALVAGRRYKTVSR